MKDSWIEYTQWQKRPQKDAHIHMSPPSDWEVEIFNPWNRTPSEMLLDTIDSISRKPISLHIQF